MKDMGAAPNRRAILGGWLGEGNAYPKQYWYVAATWGGSEVTASERTLFSLYAGANILFHVLALSGAATDLPERMALALVMVLLALLLFSLVYGPLLLRPSIDE